MGNDRGRPYGNRLIYPSNLTQFVNRPFFDAWSRNASNPRPGVDGTETLGVAFQNLHPSSDGGLHAAHAIN